MVEITLQEKPLKKCLPSLTANSEPVGFRAPGRKSPPMNSMTQSLNPIPISQSEVMGQGHMAASDGGGRSHSSSQCFFC